MVKIIKSNKFISLSIIGIIIFLLSRPIIVFSASLDAVSLWGYKVFPILFPMFILTRLVVSLSEENNLKINKYFSRIYNCPPCGLQIFILAVLSGYPMGAKLIQVKLNKHEINEKQAYRMLSFCSISGPGFMIGTVGVSILFSIKAGIIITISNILGALTNGLIFRGKNHNDIKPQHSLKQKVSLNEIVYDSLKSILMVAGFMVISFLIIELVTNLNILNFLSTILSNVFNIDKSIVSASIKGLIEITRGASEIQTTTIPLKIKTVILSGLIGFGGLSIILQTKEMFDSNEFKYTKIVKQKLLQGLFSTVFAIIIVSLI